MRSEKAVHFLSQLLAYSFGRCNGLHARFAQALHGTKFSEKEILPVLAYSRTIVEHAFVDPFFHQELMISIRETVGFVANSLEQTQRAGIVRQTKRERTARPVNFLELFREPDDRQIVQA